MKLAPGRRPGTLARALAGVARAALPRRLAGSGESELEEARRSELSILVRLLILGRNARRRAKEPASLDAAVERVFEKAPARVAGPAPREIPESALALDDVPPRDLARFFEELLGTRLVVYGGDLALARGGRARKDRGTFFTPPSVARALAKRALEPLVARETPFVVDPAAGTGGLLDAAASLLLAARGGGRRAREHIAARMLGADSDPDAVLLARAVLRERLGAEPRVIHADALATRALAREHEGAALAPPLDAAIDFPGLGKGEPLAILGNPPFVATYARGAVRLEDARRRLLAARFPALGPGRGNAFLHFLALSLELASGRAGRTSLGLVLPDAFLVNERYEASRRELLAASSRLSVLLLDWPAFGRAAVRTALVVAALGGARGPRARFRIAVFPSERALEEDRPLEVQGATRAALEARPSVAFPRRRTDLGLEKKIREAGAPLESLCWVRDGINPGPRSFRSVIVLDEEGDRNGSVKDPFVHPCLEGRDVFRYAVAKPRLRVRTDPSLLTPELRQRGASFRESWIFDGEKLVSRQTSPTLVFAREPSGFRALNSVHATGLLPGTEESLLYILAVLNSAPLRWYYARASGETRSVFPQVHVAALRRLPVPRAASESALVHDEVASLARRLESCPADAEAEAAVDRLVSDLLGLTREEAERVSREAPPCPRLLK